MSDVSGNSKADPALAADESRKPVRRLHVPAVTCLLASFAPELFWLMGLPIPGSSQSRTVLIFVLPVVFPAATMWSSIQVGHTIEKNPTKLYGMPLTEIAVAVSFLHLLLGIAFVAFLIWIVSSFPAKS